MIASRGIVIALGGVLMAGALAGVGIAQRYGQGLVPYDDHRYYGPRVLPNVVPTYRAGVGVVHVPIPMVGKTQLAESQLKWNWGAVSEDSPLKLRLPATAPVPGANPALALAGGPSQATDRLGSGGQGFSGSGFAALASEGSGVPKLSLPLDRTGKSLSQMPAAIPGGAPWVDLERNWGRKLTSARTNWRETNVAAAKSVEEALKQAAPPQNFAAPNAGPTGDWWNGASPAALIGSPVEGARMIWDENRPWSVVPPWHEWTESTEAWQGAP